MAREIKHLNTKVQEQKTITYELDIDGVVYFVKDYYNVEGDDIEETTLYNKEGKQVDPNDPSTLAADIYAFIDDVVDIEDEDLVMNPQEDEEFIDDDTNFDVDGEPLIKESQPSPPPSPEY